MTSASNLPVAAWRKSSYSGPNGGDCVEVGVGISGVAPVRDSKNPEGPALLFPTPTWSTFLTALKSGHFPL
ncbi:MULTISPECIES: DUF397 domain-containing protein [unclassified Streptomyces]|uniref:DUF397 domain-containing protein n=1 Tax=unclassified Streptomyces TaxID=2593676 RepID=UPI002E2E649E|nr:DUF397 domain-containing protein [Streptomyces sp. NBC_00223]